ncbi:MAG: DUF4157 domain-containing protein [Nitrospirae bacterium]|nr:MAG: DUF4157 domain-containing protein [Nitrospirota bacterium]
MKAFGISQQPHRNLGRSQTPPRPHDNTIPAQHQSALLGKDTRTPLFLRQDNQPALIEDNFPTMSAAISQTSAHPLPTSLRQSFESQLGYDLGQVRVHADRGAAESAQALRAKAYTTGTNIVFGEGYYRPDTKEGKRLLAHELVHVVQQASGHAPRGPSSDRPVIPPPSHSSERDADRQADTLLRHATHRAPSSSADRNSAFHKPYSPQGFKPLTASPGSTIQRQEEEDWRLQLFPPRLSGPLGPLSFSATTSQAQLGYASDLFRAGLGYQYGGELFATGRYGGLSGRLGVNPQSGAFSLGGSYDRFRFGLQGSPSGSFGASLGYGAPLLPLPSELSRTVYGGAAGLHGVVGAIPEFLQNPIGTYGAQSENIDAMIAAGKMLGRLAGQEHGGPNFGAGLRVGWDPQRGWVVFGGVQGSF